VENLLSTLKSVSEVIDDFQRGNIAIPEIQRDVVWDADQIKNLIDSITRGYPCGALIFWEPRERDKQLVKSMIRPERLKLYDGRLPRYFLLDGQQRVTALASVILKRERLREILIEIEEEMPYVFVNLKPKEKELEATFDPAGYSFPWVLFNELFDGSFHNKLDLSQLPHEKIEAIQLYIQRLRDYQFPVQIISGRDYATVGEIFTRVNSAGTQLTGAEIHLARIVPHWKGITREFRQYRNELARRNYDLDLTFLMRSITAVECNVPQIKKLADKISKDRPSRQYLNKTWRKARGAIDRMIRILQRGLSLDKSKFFTSKNTLVPLVYCLANVDGDQRLERNVLRFFLLSQLSEHYGAAAETALRKDFRRLVDWSATAENGLKLLVEYVSIEAQEKYPKLRVEHKHVSGVPSKNVLVLLMYVLMRRNEATDWGAGKRPTLDEIEPRQIQLHHIYPFDYMNKNELARQPFTDRGYSAVEFRSEINDIANLTFLSQQKNAEISDTPPSQYLLNETTKEMRRAHFIPEDEELWKAENFASFLYHRRCMLAKAMTRLIKGL